jgi:hypothetical protein
VSRNQEEQDVLRGMIGVKDAELDRLNVTIANLQRAIA